MRSGEACAIREFPNGINSLSDPGIARSPALDLQSLLWCALGLSLAVTGLAAYKLAVQLRPPRYRPSRSKLLWSLLLFIAPPRHRLLSDQREGKEI